MTNFNDLLTPSSCIGVKTLVDDNLTRSASIIQNKNYPLKFRWIEYQINHINQVNIKRCLSEEIGRKINCLCKVFSIDDLPKCRRISENT
jgi:hypothetical protein